MILFYLKGKFECGEPTLQEKVLFWKGHRDYVKTEFNRMRQVSIKGFKDSFIKGMTTLCTNYDSSCFIITTICNCNFVLFFTTIEYIKEEGIGRNSTSDFCRLIEFCTDRGERFGGDLLNYPNVSMELVYCFLNICMPSISIVNYKDKMLTERLSNVINIGEEAFAVLLFENNFKRWVYMAKRQINETETERRRLAKEGEQAERQSSGGDRDSQSYDENIPDVLYQQNIKMRKDKRLTAGRWTDKGMKRLNELIQIVTEMRQKEERREFEVGLKDMYEDRLTSDEKRVAMNKRIREEAKLEKNKRQKVRCVDLLTFDD